MKTLTIGRDSGSDIVIDDKMISRRHAVLRIYSTGKMELVDMSSNGTFVNGVKLASNVPFPVTRKNTVDFAHVKHLDWTHVPNPLSWVKWAVLALIGLGIIIVIIFALMKYIGGSENNTQYDNSNNIEITAGKTSSDGIKTGSSDAATEEGTVAKGTNESTDKDSAKSGSKNWYEKELAKERNRKVAAGKEKTKSSNNDKDSKSQKSAEDNNSNNSVVF